MILNASGRTDIVAFYTPWFMNRYPKDFSMFEIPSIATW